jgi:hypothetical protein
MNSPSTAPAQTFSAVSAISASTTFNDTFQTNQGWTVTNGAGLTTGAWERATPTPSSAAPSADADGSGMCYVTQNTFGEDVDNSSTTLTSPTIDASTGTPVLSYHRWYNNSTGNAPMADVMVVEFSINGGTSWLPLETVGPNASSANPEVTGGWVAKSFNLLDVAGFSLTSQLRVRFTASDLATQSYVEAGVDGVKLTKLVCQAPNCLGDIAPVGSPDGSVGPADLAQLLSSWGPCPNPCSADIAPVGSPDGTVGPADLGQLLAGWGQCK